MRMDSAICDKPFILPNTRSNSFPNGSPFDELRANGTFRHPQTPFASAHKCRSPIFNFHITYDKRE